MKSLVVAAVVLAAAGIARPAAAADMALKGPLLPPAAAPIYNWSGYYFGGNVGYSWGKEDLEVTDFSVNVVPTLGGDPAGLRPTGVIGGAQIGINWQTENVVFGLEADFQGADQKDSITSAGLFTWYGYDQPGCFGDANMNMPCTLTGTGSSTLTTKIDWVGTLRGRFGLAADQFLFYGTGGLAYGRVRTYGVASINGIFTDFSGGACDASGPGCAASGSATYSDSATRLGWSAGAGVEAALPFAGSFTWRVEYLYVDLGTITATTAYGSSISIPGAALAQSTTASVTHSARVTDNIVRFGFNYRFSGDVPIVARN